MDDRAGNSRDHSDRERDDDVAEHRIGLNEPSRGLGFAMWIVYPGVMRHRTVSHLGILQAITERENDGDEKKGDVQ